MRNFFLNYCQQILWSHHDITQLPCSFFKHWLDWTICVSGVEHLPCMCWGLSFIYIFVTKKQTRMEGRFHGHYRVTSWVYSHCQKLGSMNVMKMKWTCFTEDTRVGVDMHHYMLTYKQSLRVVGSTSGSSLCKTDIDTWSGCPHCPASVDLQAI